MQEGSLWEIFWRRRMAIVWVLTLSAVLGIAIARLLPPSFEATAGVMLVPAAAETQTQNKTSSIDLPGLLTSTTVLSAVRDELNLPRSLKEMRSALVVKTPEYQSNLMPITVRDPVPARAVATVNALADELSQFYRDIAARRYTEEATYLSAALTQQRTRIRALDRQLQAASSRNAFVGSAKAVDAIALQLDALTGERGNAYATMVSDEAQLESITHHFAQAQPIVKRELIDNDPVSRALREQLAKDTAALDSAKAEFTEAYPGLPDLQARVDGVRAQLTQAEARAAGAPEANSTSYAAWLLDRGKASASVNGDRARVAALDSEIAQTKARLHDLPRGGVTVDSLRLERDADQAAYQALAARLSSALADQAEAASLGSIVVVDRAARAESTLSKQAWLFAPVVALFALGLALGFAYFLECADPRIRSSLQVEQLYGRPIIADLR
ncbi:MAG: GumC family protein [Vulcanimicrobiaceae bacterium]